MRRFITIFVATKARMAESVDALVSNTSGAIHLGSSPSPGTPDTLCSIACRVYFFALKIPVKALSFRKTQ